MLCYFSTYTFFKPRFFQISLTLLKFCKEQKIMESYTNEHHTCCIGIDVNSNLTFLLKVYFAWMGKITNTITIIWKLHSHAHSKQNYHGHIISSVREIQIKWEPIQLFVYYLIFNMNPDYKILNNVIIHVIMFCVI